MADKPSPKQKRITVDIKHIVDEIDAYPEQAGIDPDLWNEMSYPQKCIYLAKKELQAARELSKDDD